MSTNGPNHLWSPKNKDFISNLMRAPLSFYLGDSLVLLNIKKILHISCFYMCSTQSPPIICKAPTANRQRRWASYPTLWSTATLDCVATSREKTIIFNQLHIVNHSWSGVSQEKYTFNHPHKPCTLSVGLEVELCIWLCQSIWWPSSWCTNFTSHSASF